MESVWMLDVSKIKASPYQSRSTMDMVELVVLQTSIFTERLDQPVEVRPIGMGADIEYELTDGHRRHESFVQLHKRGWKLGEHKAGPMVAEYWDGETTRIPALVRSLSNEEAGRTILRSNRLRVDVNPMDEIRACRRVLDLTDCSQSELAISLGISTSQLSNQLRLLRLPEGLQDCVAEGLLAWTTARELLAFVGPDCDHSKELAYVEKEVRKHGGAMPLSGLRGEMHQARERNKEEWRRLTGTFEYYHYDKEPMFDTGEFEEEHRTQVHTLPYNYSGGAYIYTCALADFDEEQRVGEEAIKSMEDAMELDDEGVESVDTAPDQRSGATDEELQAFDDKFEVECDRRDEAIKAMYARIGPSIGAMDDGIVNRQLFLRYGDEIKTWAGSVDYRGPFSWRHGWHVREIMYLFGMHVEVPKDRWDWQLGEMESAVFGEHVAKLGRKDRREVLRLILAAVNARCAGRCGRAIDGLSFCIGCSAIPIEEEPTVELHEAS